MREIRINEFRQDITSKGPFPGTYHSQSEKILETEKDMNASCNGERDIEGQVEEEYIRDMASRVLQARWRIMRFLSSFISLFPPLYKLFDSSYDNVSNYDDDDDDDYVIHDI